MKNNSDGGNGNVVLTTISAVTPGSNGNNSPPGGAQVPCFHCQNLITNFNYEEKFWQGVLSNFSKTSKLLHIESFDIPSSIINLMFLYSGQLYMSLEKKFVISFLFVSW